MKPPFSNGRHTSAQQKSTAPPKRVQDLACSCGSHDDLLTISQVAQRLFVARQTAHEWIVNQHRIPFHRLGVKAIRVRRSDLEAYLKENRHGDKAAS